MPKQKGSIDLKTSGYLYGQISSLESQVDGQIQTWAQDTNPASNWSADEKASRVGDLWLFTGTSDNTTIQQGLTLHPQGIYKYVYDSVNSVYKWEAHSSTNNNIFDLADGKKRVFYGTTLPSTPYDLNDVWVQGENGDIKVCRTARSSGSGANSDWVLASKYTNDAAFIAFRDGSYATFVRNTNTTLSQKITTFYDSQTPTAIVEGDLWIDTGNDNTLKRWNGTSWEPVRDAGIQSALTAASNAQSTADRKIVTYALDDPPGPPSYTLDVGDLWIDTNNNNKLYRWSGSTWTPFTDTSELEAFKTIYTADKSNILDQLDKKAETWYQSSDPSDDWSGHESEHEGDLWYDTTDGTTWYYAKQGTDPETYDWEQQNVPDAVFDKIDGKKDIHYTNNAPLHPPYNAGDLWSNGIDLRICITSKADGESYSISDWVLASNYIDSADATSIASAEANKTKTTETKTLYYISTSSNAPTGGSWVDETTITTADVLNKYLFVKIQNKINGAWVDATPSPGWQKSNLYNGIYTFANTVAGDSGLTTINGSKITTGRIQDSTGKNFIQIASAGTTTAGHLEFKDGNDWDHSSQGIQWNSSQGQLNVKGHIYANSLTILGNDGTTYNGSDAINISGYSIEITTNDEGSTGTDSANNVWLYPHLYHNGIEVFYILTSDTTAQSGKTYYYYDSTEEEYVAYTTAPQNPKADNAYESIDYTKFHWYRNGSSSYEIGAQASGRLLVYFSDSIKVTYTFDDGATNGGMTAMQVTVDPQKYITRISDVGIEIHPEDTSGNDKLTINSSSIDIYRNNVSMLHLEDSSGRFGNTTNYTNISSTNGIEIYRNGTKRAQFDSDINLYSSDQSKRLNLSTNGLHLYNGNDDIATFSDSSIELKTDFGGSASLYAATDDGVDYIGFHIKGYDGRTIFSVYDSELDQDYDRNITLNSPTYLNSLVFISTQAGQWPLDWFIEGEGNGREATSNTTTSLYYDDLNAITPYQNRCYIRTGSRAMTFGRWAFVQLDITIRVADTISANNYWTVLTGAPAPSTGYAALSAVAPARNNGALSAYVTSSGSITIVTDDAEIPQDGRVTITGWYYLAQEGDPPAIIIV